MKIVFTATMGPPSPPTSGSVVFDAPTPVYFFTASRGELVHPFFTMDSAMAWCRIVYTDMAGRRYMEFFRFHGYYRTRNPVDTKYTFDFHEEFDLTEADQPLSLNRLAAKYPAKKFHNPYQ